MAERDDTCCRCAKEPGEYECANCREFPLCQECVDEFAKNDWKGHVCFCVQPKHVMAIIQTYDYDSDDGDCINWSGWSTGARDAVEIIK